MWLYNWEENRRFPLPDLNRMKRRHDWYKSTGKLEGKEDRIVCRQSHRQSEWSSR